VRPYFRPDRGTWEVSVPSSLSKGKRYRPSFPDLAQAEKWLAEKSLESAQGKVTTLTSKSGGGMLVSELVALFLREKTGGMGAESARILTIRLGKLLAKFGNRHADEVTPWEAKRWLAGLGPSQRSRFGIFSECRGLYRWAIRYRIQKENPFDQMEPENKGQAAKAILTPDQMRKLLEMDCPEFFRAWLALGAFAGLRTIEIQRMDWKAVNRRGRQIFIGSEVIKKTRGLRHRYVSILPALRRHLPRCSSGAVVPVVRNTFADWRIKACEVMGWQRWPQNALRHSFASYHLAAFCDSAKTAHEMGHTSAEMVHSNYAEAVTKKAAREWWAL